MFVEWVVFDFRCVCKTFVGFALNAFAFPLGIRLICVGVEVSLDFRLDWIWAGVCLWAFGCALDVRWLFVGVCQCQVAMLAGVSADARKMFVVFP